jgi:tricorn protease
MKKGSVYTYFRIFICLLCVGIFLHSEGINTKDTKMLTQPAVSSTRIAFVYANDLWVADIDGTNARQITTHKGREINPVFSPDGKWIAFSGQYDGNTDVYMVSAEGGIPERLTWHPYTDQVRGFTPDGEAVLFNSSRFAANRNRGRLFTVSIEGGMPEPMKIPYADKAVYSPDGTRMAYTPFGEAFHQWKHYRGGTHSRIWIFRFSDNTVEKIPQPQGRCNDTDPMWIGDKIYFRSDRNGEFNLFSYDTQTKEIQQLTQFTDFPVLFASAGAGKIIFERAGHIHLYHPSSGQSQKLTVGAAADLLELRPRYVKGERYIRHGDISPTGARAVLEFRGEIITVPAEKGDYRNLTDTAGIHERDPVWSPDGQKIAYFSDESGEYTLHVLDRETDEVKKYALDGAGFYSDLAWSPDSQKLAYTDNSWSLYWIPLDTGKITKIGQEYLYGPFKTIKGVWSPDSRWLAYTLNTAAYTQKVYLYSTAEGKSFPVTDGLSDVSDPVFDPSGKYLYFFASTDAGPVKHWFAMSNADMEMTRAIYLAVLQKGVPSPLAKESDEEKGTAEEKKDQDNEKQEEEKGKKKDKKTNKKPEKALEVDFERLNERILSLPIPTGNYYELKVAGEGKVYYMEAPPAGRGPFSRETELHMFDLDKRKDEVLISNVNRYEISADHKKLLYASRNTWGIADAGKKIKPGEGKINVAAIEVRIDPAKEWKQIFKDAWRINRDYFYDPNMHGVDWKAMFDKYAVFLPHLSCRDDLNTVIQWMCSELGVGHHRVRGGDTLARPDRVPVGLLGADYVVENGRYRFKKVYGGLNWNPELRSPLTEPGVDVKDGEYLLAVRGEEVRHPQNLFRFFENAAGKLIEISVGSDSEGKGSRTVKVVPVSSENALRNRDWVESNIRKVDKATAGRVAYVYVPNTAGLGHVYFKRYFFPQSHKDAIIVDERFNGGGSVADYYIDILKREYVCMWNMRYGADLKTPSASIQGPKVMLINESAGSGGDLLPWMFRKFKLGKLIGTRTWGGLVGTLGFPVLMDGGYVTAPNLAIWTEDGWVVERIGVPPDIEVEQVPAEMIEGHDLQLEKAIQVILEELEKNPPQERKRPPYKKIK